MNKAVLRLYIVVLILFAVLVGFTSRWTVFEASALRDNPLNQRTLLEERKIVVQLDGKARDWLAERGYDPAYGARPLKRVIQKSVQDPLAELILSGKVKDGDKVAISAGRQGITFNGQAVKEAA